MKTIFKLTLVLMVVVFASCRDLTKTNVDPNTISQITVDPNYVMTTSIVNTVRPYQDENYNGDCAGIMSYVQKSGWGSGLQYFNWTDNRSWAGNYGTLRDIYLLRDRATDSKSDFHLGVALILKSFTFAQITSLWGDAPYSDAGLGALNTKPKFDAQEDIFKGILADLKTANTLLSKPATAYGNINPSADVIYAGNPAKWQKLANSLRLRYLMRLSVKSPAVAKAGIEEIMGNPTTYPIFSSTADDALMSYPGLSSADSWNTAIAWDGTPAQGNFTRLQLCAYFRDVLVGVNDPRLPVWFKPVASKVTVASIPANTSTTTYRIYTPSNWISATPTSTTGVVLVDTANYVGIPLAIAKNEPFTYNLNPSPVQGGANIHVSGMTDMFKANANALLKARAITYAEVCFILAEAAQRGYATGGTQQTFYNSGIQASLTTWGVGSSYATYIAKAGVAYDGTLSQLMTQKYISGFLNAQETWFDWRRTGLPVIPIGNAGYKNTLPLRWRYDMTELNINVVNSTAAISKLVPTANTGQTGNDDSWSKMWLLQ
ncbi:MAG: SusD/RagB family nutrient-binding outer membrane lipoprotein [Bacteroidia bacterium]|nr:SusD/RagB family nutrient-binding outer membrane lipoprotein [Bacteroidia bacterium]